MDFVLKLRLEVVESAIVLWWVVSFKYFAPRMGNKLTNCLMEWVDFMIFDKCTANVEIIF